MSDIGDLVMTPRGGGLSFVASYRELLHTFLDAGFVHCSHAQAFDHSSLPEKAAFVRHDVDHDLKTAIKMAHIEHDLGIRSTYFLLHPGDFGQTRNYYGAIVRGRIVPSAGMQAAARELVALGHEVGLHNDLVQLSMKTGRTIEELLGEQLEIFAALDIPLSGTASHGSRFAREHGFVNYEIFTECLPKGEVPRSIVFDEHREQALFDVSFRQLGLNYEAYSIPRDCYISDSGGRFSVGATRLLHVDPASIRASLADKRRVVALLHPDWWQSTQPSRRRLVAAANTAGDAADQIKASEVMPLFRRSDGSPLRVAVRGDCCGRRMIAMNPEMFPDGVRLLVNEKCPNAAFVDSLQGLTATGEELQELSDTSRMSATLREYYLHQNDRSVMDARDLDLLVMDSYSDMNFELWKLKERGCKVWVHPEFLRRESPLVEQLVRIGRATLDDAVAHVVAVIDHLRTLNPGLPVLFLTQPVEFYPKLSGRREFDRLGARVAELRAGVYFCDPLAPELIEPADLGSCGPGLTLHFSAKTYRHMVIQAWRRGLALHFNGSDSARREVIAAPHKSAPEISPMKIVIRSMSRRFTEPYRRAVERAQDILRYLRGFDSFSNAARWFCERAWSRIYSRVRGFAPRGAATPSVIKQAFDESDLARVSVSFIRDSATCKPQCARSVDRAFESYRDYFCFPAREKTQRKRYTPMLIDCDSLLDFAAWEAHIKRFGKGARLRQKHKAERAGYVVHQFVWQQFIPDIHEINHSKEVRSGGPMRGHYLRSLGEMGGAAQKVLTTAAPACPYHWSLSFGAFMPEPGHCQGEIQVDERLVAYIALQRCGEVLLYSMIMGHGAHLASGPLVLLHHELIKWINEQRDDLTRDLRYVMYGGLENGGENLLQWKRQAGFTPHLVDATDGS